jgi:dihydrofolate reductase
MAVFAHVTVSVDGYMAGPDISAQEPMGRDGARLHEWIFADNEVDKSRVQDTFAAVGAVVLGRRTFDVGLNEWGDTPYPAPSFVLTHRAEPDREMKSASFHFVTDGIGNALTRARAAAGDKDVILMGGETIQQALRDGLVDRLNLQIAPVLLGDGLRMFEETGHFELKPLAVTVSPTVTHMQYEIVR